MKTKSQIFKKKIDYVVIVNFIKTNLIYDKLNGTYISNFTTFKKMLLTKKLHEFQEYIQSFYYLSKQNYPSNIFTYRGFNVVLRQIVKNLDLIYTYKIKYIHSDYIIEYYITI
jgi:hypothetical protein